MELSLSYLIELQEDPVSSFFCGINQDGFCVLNKVINKSDDIIEKNCTSCKNRTGLSKLMKVI